jgi:diguanylate cyclase (GGDEF)-like protein/PAS domain S-box-containing protein
MMPKKYRPGVTSFRRQQKSSLEVRRSATRDRALARLVGKSKGSFILNSSNDAILIKTLDGTIVSWNRAAETMYGYTASEIVGKSVFTLIPPEARNQIPPLLQILKQGQRVDHFEAPRLKKDGTRINVSVTLSPVLGTHERVLGVLAIARDITDRKRSEDTVRRLVTHDALTDVANYRGFMEICDSELRRSDRTGRPFALLAVDLDRLKQINDQHGHLVGNRALCRVADVLKRTCRSIDTPARYGGDEFAVILPECSESASSHVARRIKEKLAEDTESPLLTVSTGIAVYSQDCCTVEGLMAAADRSLYKAKMRYEVCARSRADQITQIRHPERRRSERRLLDIPVVLYGESLTGKMFQEETFTISVSAHGALVLMTTKVAPAQKIVLKNEQTKEQIEGKVACFHPVFGGMVQVAIEFAKPASRFWCCECTTK